MIPASRTALHRLGALALVLGLVLCLLLPGILCRAELAALERGTLERPTLEIELEQTGRETRWPWPSTRGAPSMTAAMWPSIWTWTGRASPPSSPRRWIS